MNSRPRWVESLRIRTHQQEDPNESWVLSPVRSPKSTALVEDAYGKRSTKSPPKNVSKPSIFARFRKGKKRLSTHIDENDKSRSRSSSRAEMMCENRPIPTTPQTHFRTLNQQNSENRPEACSPLACFVDFSGEALLLPSLSKLIDEETGFSLTEQAKLGGREVAPSAASSGSVFVPITKQDSLPRNSLLISANSFPMSPREAAPSRAEFIPPISL